MIICNKTQPIYPRRILVLWQPCQSEDTQVPVFSLLASLRIGHVATIDIFVPRIVIAPTCGQSWRSLFISRILYTGSCEFLHNINEYELFSSGGGGLFWMCNPVGLLVSSRSTAQRMEDLWMTKMHFLIHCSIFSPFVVFQNNVPSKPRPCRKQLSVVGVMGPSSACSPVLATTLATRDASSPSCESNVTVLASSTSGGDVAKTSKRTAIFVERATYVLCMLLKKRTSVWLEYLQ